MKTLVLTCGSNLVDPAAWNGWDGYLPDCDIDAMNLALIFGECATSEQSEVRSLINRYRGTVTPGQLGESGPYTEKLDFTRPNLEKWLRYFAAKSGDETTVIVCVSGHGSVYATLHELDLTGEAFCLADGLLKDTELLALLCAFKPGVRIVVIADTCFSGGMSRGRMLGLSKAAPDYVRRAIAPQETPRIVPQAGVLWLLACGENETALSTGKGGAFTSSLYRVWKNYAPADKAVLTWRRWFEDTAAFMKPIFAQHPRLRISGPDFSNERILA